MHGGVGCGKTMIMDQFYDNVHSRAKQRTHFHDFMLDVHERIHKYKSSLSRAELRQVDKLLGKSFFSLSIFFLLLIIFLNYDFSYHIVD